MVEGVTVALAIRVRLGARMGTARRLAGSGGFLAEVDTMEAGRIEVMIATVGMGDLDTC